MAKKLTLEEKVSYMRIGVGLVGIPINDAMAEILVKTYEGILTKGGRFSIDDAAKIEIEVTGKFKDKEIKSEQK